MSEVVVINADGDFAQETAQSFKVADGNPFRGWHCAVGLQNLWINAQGDVYGAVCRAGDSLGNVFQDFSFRTQLHVCEKERCYCTTDIKIPKTRTGNFSFSLKRKVEALDSRDAVIVGGGRDLKFEQAAVQVNWNLGRRCNFDCAYCPPSVHDNHSDFIDGERLRSAIERVMEKAAATRADNQRGVNFVFTGGEPTLHPDYLDVLTQVKEKYGARVTFCTNTNGTRSESYLVELARISHLYWSIHFEFSKPKLVLPRLLAIAADKAQRQDYSMDVAVKLMAGPGQLDIVKEWHETLLQNRPHPRAWRLTVEPLVDKGAKYALAPYAEQERELIRALNKNATTIAVSVG